MFQILVAEDDIALRNLFCKVLQNHGFSTIPVADGQEALEVIEKDYVDLVISDIMMPRVDGYGLVKTLRQAGIQVPILMITAREGFRDMEFGFQVGADDYMVKPINVNELVLRVNALLRRAKMVVERRQTVGDTVLDYDAFTVRTQGKEYLLPQKEFQLLYKLLSSAGQIFTRQQLMDEIWGYDSSTEPRTVDVHINRLRDHFRNNRDFEIVTVRGIGYKAVKHHEG